MRYQVREGSQTGHCCFEATVVDTAQPDIIHGEHYQDSSGQYHYEVVCECFSPEDAEKICAALNAAEAPTDEEIRKQFKGLANQLTFMFALLVLIVCIGVTAVMHVTHGLICSAENPPQACRE